MAAVSVSDTRSVWQQPMQWPRTRERAPARTGMGTERVLKAALLLCLLAPTVFARFGLALSTSYSIPSDLMAMYALVVAMVACGAAEVNVRGALAYVAVIGVAMLSVLVNGYFGAPQSVSVASFLLLMGLYAPFALSLRRDAVTSTLWVWLIRMYLRIALLLAVAGIVQFFAQFVFNPPWLFDFRPSIPAALRASGEYFTINHAGEWLKANGFFLREPTSFSFEMAFALLCEWSLSQRKWAMALFATGLVLSYSGSGLAALAFAMLFPLGRRSLLRLAAVALLASLLFFALSDLLNLSYTMNRLQEFGNSRSSGYARFIEPGVALLEYSDTDLWTALLGHGPGSLPRMAHAFESTFAKVPFEYGLLGTLALGVLLWDALNRSSAPVRLRAAAGVGWLVLGSALLSASAVLGIYVFLALWPHGAAARAVKEAAR